MGAPFFPPAGATDAARALAKAGEALARARGDIDAAAAQLEARWQAARAARGGIAQQPDPPDSARKPRNSTIPQRPQTLR